MTGPTLPAGSGRLGASDEASSCEVAESGA